MAAGAWPLGSLSYKQIYPLSSLSCRSRCIPSSCRASVGLMQEEMLEHSLFLLLAAPSAGQSVASLRSFKPARSSVFLSSPLLSSPLLA